MVLKKLNFIKLNDLTTKQIEDQLNRDNNTVDASEADDRAGMIASTFKNLVGLNYTASSQIAVHEEKKKFKERDKNRRSAGRNIFKSLQASLPNFNLNNSMEGFLASAKELTHRMTSLSSGKFLDTVFAFFANGRRVNHVA